MMTRTGKPITVFDHILDDIGNVLNQGEVIDGELYAEGLCFEEITGLCRTEKVVAAHIKIHFYCFDFFSLDNLSEPFEKRFRKLETLFKSFGQQHVHLVETTRVLSKKTVSRWHDTFVEKGYEGIMIRDANGTYGLNERSNHLLKLKNFQTDEYRVVGAEEATGKDAGTVVWICETSDGKKFNVRPKGSHKQRTAWLEFRDVSCVVHSVLKVDIIPLPVNLVITFLRLQPEPILGIGEASSIYRRPEGVIIGDGGYFWLEVYSSTRNLIDGFVRYGNKDVSEVI
jgi:hypothetical protein